MRSHRILLNTLIILLAWSTPSHPATETRHDLVLLPLDSPAGADFLNTHRGSWDILLYKADQYAHLALQPDQLQILRDANLPFEILQKDMESAYARRTKGIGFGVYHTWSENVAFIDSLHLLYPDIVSAKWSLGQSHEGRDIWCFKVSDNPEIDENEPEILIDGLHHAREIMAAEFPLMFAEYLAQGYGDDPEITWLVDHRELYLVPVVNPDGFVYNETISPDGGGMWRKNRRDNLDGTFGVDPNRNYPFKWAYDDLGSSPDPGSDLYRGPSAGSEPEVQALMTFFDSRQIITHDTIHAYSNLLLFPWGYTSDPTEDNLEFTHMASRMTQFNGYTPGQPGALLYDVNGSTFDWVYGDRSEHGRVFTFSSEIGSSADGFWPLETRRGPLFQENIWPHIYLMRAAGPFVAVHSPVVAATAKSIGPGQTGALDFTVENQSILENATGLAVTLGSADPWIQLLDATADIGDLAPMAAVTLGTAALPFTVDPDCPDGHVATVTAVLHMIGSDLPFELDFTIGTPLTLFADDFSNGIGNWILAGNWGLTTATAHSAGVCLTDSPDGLYPDQTIATATLLDRYQAGGLTFWHKFSTESGWDFGRVQVSPDSRSWTTLASYTGSQADWQLVTIDLSDYRDQELFIRFAMESDAAVTDDGWYIDDVQLVGSDPDNLAPSIPVALSPGEGEVVDPYPVLTVANSTDPEGGPLTYGFLIYADALGTDLFTRVDQVPAGPEGQTTWTSDRLLASMGSYWWRAYAGDGEQRSDLTPLTAMVVSEYLPADGGVILPLVRILNGVNGGRARLQLNLATAGQVRVEIYDARGARLREIHHGYLDAGTRVMVWDGRDGHGRTAASGVYFARVTAGDNRRVARMVMVR